MDEIVGIGRFEIAVRVLFSVARKVFVCSCVNVLRSFKSAPAQNEVVGELEAIMRERTDFVGLFFVVRWLM